MSDQPESILGEARWFIGEASKEKSRHGICVSLVERLAKEIERLQAEIKAMETKETK